MKIVKLSIHNFLKLKDVEINPTHTNVIVGKNKQGKTSILKAIRTAFDGKADATSIRVGESKAEITLELDDLIINRSVTEKGNYLKVSNSAGMQMPAPQKYLDGILGTFSFNPIEFFDKKPADRKKYLLDAVKINITQQELAEYTGEELDGLDYEGTHALEIVGLAHKHYYDLRTVANAEVKKKEKSLEDLNGQIPEGFDPKSVSTEQLTALRQAVATDKEMAIKKEAHEEKIEGLKKRELELKAELNGVEKEIIGALEVTFDCSDNMAIQAAEDTIKELEGQSEIVFTVKRAGEVRVELDEATKSATSLDKIVKGLSKEIPDALIAKAELPIEGLKIDGNNIFVGDVNIDNMSGSEQLRFGLDIVRSLNGTFKVICVDGIEALDKESFEFFLNEIKDDEFQYFVTRVEGESEHSIVVDDGEVVQS